MMRFFCRAVLFAVLASCMVASAAQAQCPMENGQIVAYFDAAGTQRSMDAGPVGHVLTIHWFGEGVEANAFFASGAQFAVDYGPNMRWLADVPLHGAFIGNTPDEIEYPPNSGNLVPSGYSVGFGYNPQVGNKFEIVRSVCLWTADDCSAGMNVDGPVVVKHPLFPDNCPVVSRFPDNSVFDVFGARSQTCQLVELDIKPGSCRNPFSINIFGWLQSGRVKKGGVLPVAILGSETVDVNDIDPASIFLEGVAPLRYAYEDVSTLDGEGGCVCNDGGADGYMDMTLKFSKQAVAAALLDSDPYVVGQEIVLMLTGEYWDGMTFSAMDCIEFVGSEKVKDGPGWPDIGGVSGLGFPTPNPFNPVSRISYSVPATQHVRIAIYDVAGRLVEDLVNETKGAGEYVAEWDAGRLPSGVYFYRMETGDRTIVRRATLLK